MGGLRASGTSGSLRAPGRNQGAICVRVRRFSAAPPDWADRLCVPRVRMAAQGHRAGRPSSCCSISTARREPGSRYRDYRRSMKSRTLLAQLYGCVLGGTRRGKKPEPAANKMADRKSASSVEPAVDEGLSDRAQHAAVASLDARQHRFIGQRPDAHRAFERPVVRGAPVSASSLPDVYGDRRRACSRTGACVRRGGCPMRRPERRDTPAYR